MEIDVGAWAVFLFWCLVVTGALLVVRWVAGRWEREQGQDRFSINRYLELLGESYPPRRPRPARGRPLPPELAGEVYATIGRVRHQHVRQLMLEGVHQIERDAVPDTGGTVFGRGASASGGAPSRPAQPRPLLTPARSWSAAL